MLHITDTWRNVTTVSWAEGVVSAFPPFSTCNRAALRRRVIVRQNGRVSGGRRRSEVTLRHPMRIMRYYYHRFIINEAFSFSRHDSVASISRTGRVRVYTRIRVQYSCTMLILKKKHWKTKKKKTEIPFPRSGPSVRKIRNTKKKKKKHRILFRGAFSGWHCRLLCPRARCSLINSPAAAIRRPVVLARRKCLLVFTIIIIIIVVVIIVVVVINDVLKSRVFVVCGWGGGRGAKCVLHTRCCCLSCNIEGGLWLEKPQKSPQSTRSEFCTGTEKKKTRTITHDGFLRVYFCIYFTTDLLRVKFCREFL